MSADRTISEFHATRESGTGCPEVDGGPHYFAFIDPSIDIGGALGITRQSAQERYGKDAA